MPAQEVDGKRATSGRQDLSAESHLGDQLEGRERELFHGGGFEQYVDKVAALEKALGIYDLGQFTPQRPAGM